MELAFLLRHVLVLGNKAENVERIVAEAVILDGAAVVVMPDFDLVTIITVE